MPPFTGDTTPVRFAPEAEVENPPRPKPSPDTIALHRRFPTALDLRAGAKRTLPNFAFAYADGGAGVDAGIERNWKALKSIELMPRYGKIVAPPPTTSSLFGKEYGAPFGIAPIGGPGTCYPGAETYLSKAAQAANVPYTLGILSGIDIEEAAALAPDVCWLQLYRFPRDDHKIGFDLVRRAEAAGVNVLVLTIDTPTRTTRPREVKSGIMNPFRLSMRLRLDAMTSPHWLAALKRNGIPKFASLTPYMKPNPSLEEAAAFIQREVGGAFTWTEIARYRDKWRKPLVLKGVLHPEDARCAIELGIDGVFVTNHGGRQIDALPASIDALPAIAEAAAGKLTLVMDSGVRSGTDIARALSLGADAAFAGKSFLWSLGALGPRGPAHLIDLYREELSAALGQLGCHTVANLRDVTVRHPGAWRLADFGPRIQV